MSSYEDWLGTALKNCSLKEIPYKEFSHKKRIKKGGFGIVFKVKCKSLGEVAIKEVDYTDENESRNTFINELKQHSRAKHPRIIQFFGVAIDRDEEINYLVLEYANSGNLRQYLQKFKPKWPEKIRHTIQVAEGMCYLHSINIIHCDLHTENILIHEGDIKISDFGFSRKFENVMKTNNQKLYGVVPFIDPKKLENNKYVFNKKSDVYSFGVLMWEISNNGCCPFAQEENYIALAKSIVEGSRERPVSGTPLHYYTLYSKCWNKEPDERPSMGEVFRQLELKSSELNPKCNDTDINSDSNCGDTDSDTLKITGNRTLKFHNDSGIITSNTRSSLLWLQNAIHNKQISFFDYDEFCDKEKIIDSGLSLIYKSELTKFGLTVVLKSIKFDAEGMNMNSFVKELQLLQRVSFHPRINHFFGVTEDSFGSYMMVLQYANDGNLREYLNINFSKLLWDDKYRIAREIAEGLAFLHNNNIIHKNLHTKNILVHENKMMIADFGLSKLMTSESSSNSVIDGMPSFIDPQCFKNPTYKRNTASDIYSYGIIQWEISSGYKPFRTLKRIQIAIKIYNGERETPIKGTPREYVELYKRCWDDEPHVRPKIDEILDFFYPRINKPTSTHANTDKSTEGLIEKAISDNVINFYDYNQFSEIRMMYEEEFSLVYKASWKLFGGSIALEQLKLNNKYLNENIIKMFQLLQNNTDHQNIIKFYGLTKDPSNEHYIMVLQYPDEGKLCDYLLKKFSELQWTRKASMAIEIAEGIKYLHEHDIAHLDLNSKHIVVSKGRMLITSFGVGITECVSYSRSKTLGLPAYAEPKCIFEPTYQRDRRSDIYSFGVILWEISSGRPPFQYFESGYAISLHVFQGGRESPVEGTPPQYEQLYKLCWNTDPAERPDIVSALDTLKELQETL